MFLHVDSKDSDQTGRMSFCLFCHEAAHLCGTETKHLLCIVVLCSGSEFFNEKQHGNCFLTQICRL